ncbi:MAG: DUF3857 and transglutaminase domain-containing protein [Bacteroidota bacterium]
MRLGILLVFLFNAYLTTANVPDCEVIEYMTDLEVVNGKKLVHMSHLIQVNNRDGEQFNPIYIHFNQNWNLSDVRVRIETVDGKTIRVIKTKDMEEESAISNFSFYEDDLVKKIRVTHNRYPYRIRYEYKRRVDDFLTIARWDPYMRSTVPTRYSRLSVKIPADYSVQIFEQNTEHTTAVLPDGKKLFTWEARDIGKFKKETFSPHLNDVTPYVQIVPEDFRYGVKGNQSTWQSFGNWVYRLNEGRIDLPSNEQEKIDRMVEGIDNDLEKIRILYHNLQDHTRYINVSIDIGGLQTYPSSYVCKTGYGDCKALSNYLVAQLKYLGIPAYYTLVNAGKKPPCFKKEFPSNQFNHVIVSVPIDNDTLWLECTNNNAPFGYISDFIQNRPALLIDEDSSKLVAVPALQKKLVTENRTYTLLSSAHSIPMATLQSELRGDGFEFSRYITQDIEVRERNKYIENYLKIPEADLISWSVEDSHRDSSSVVMSASFKASRFFSQMGNMTMVLPPSIHMPDMEEPEERKWPVQIYTPYHQIDTMKLTFSSRAVIESTPSDTLLHTSIGTYSRKVKFGKGNLLLIREFDIPIQKVELSEYIEFYDFIQDVEKLEQEKILYKN